jgi:hypothetical protein
MRRKFRPIAMKAHPSFYSKLEDIRREYQEVNGIVLTVPQATKFISERIQHMKVPKIELFGGKRCLRRKQIQQI